MSAAGASFWKGVKAELPILVGVAPFGVIYGVFALDAGLTPLQAQAMSAVVFAGSAQFIMAQLFAVSTPALIIIMTAFLINLRHGLYSASVAPFVRHLPSGWQAGLAYLLTDEAYAVTINHYREPGDLTYKHWFYLGSGLALWTTWQISTASGILLGSAVPETWSLDFFISLTFIALVVTNLKDGPSLIAALIAGVVSVAGFNLPMSLGLVLAAIIGISAGVLVEDQSSPPMLGEKESP